MGDMRILPMGQSAMLVELDGLDAAMALFAAIEARRTAEIAGPHDGVRYDVFAGVREVVPAARTVLVRFDPLLTDRGALSAAVRGLTDADVSVERTTKDVTVPVMYDGEDLQSVADLLGVSAQEIVARHDGHAWRAAFGGFAPGFTYLTGGDPIFDVPRRADPRLEVPAGAVGLAGTFSGVYPRQSSGGWQLIGTTDTPMWDEHRTPPALIQPGDIVHFTPVRPSVRSVEAPPPDHEASSPRHGINGIRVDDPGMFAVFEDDGRHAATMGVTGSGASDPQAFHLANALVGNPAGTPAIETTGGGLRLTALGDVVLAVTGAPIGIVIHGTDGSRTAIGSQEPFLLAAGEQVTLGIPDHGWRDYIAMQGGFHVDRVLDSASADTLSSIGPKALQRGDTLASAHLPFASVGQPQPWPGDLPASGDLVELDVTLGPRDDWFTAQGVADLLGEEWTVTMQSNRVGLRLHGDRALERGVTRELASEGMVPGAIEIPSNGQPVLFMHDQPVTGGYPVIAVLTEHALALAGQLQPGVRIRFREYRKDCKEQ